MLRHPLPHYFFGGLTGPGSLTHAPEVPLKIWQMQAPLQWTVVLHVPLQTGIRLAGVCNCRAETVPAQSTAITMVENSVVFMILRMILFSFQLPDRTISVRSGAPLDATNKTQLLIPKERRRCSR